MIYKLSLSERLYVNLVLTLLFGLTVLLFIVVKLWEVVCMKRKCHHCSKLKVFYLWEILFKNCWACRRTIRISRHVNRKYGGVV